MERSESEGYRGRLQCFSEKDRGPADAIHKGFAKASGDILAWLNADDTYEPGAVRLAAEYLAAHPQTDVVCGDGSWITEGGQAIRRYPTLPIDSRALERDGFICQPEAFLRASAYQSCPIDRELKPLFRLRPLDSHVQTGPPVRLRTAPPGQLAYAP